MKTDRPLPSGTHSAPRGRAVSTRRWGRIGASGAAVTAAVIGWGYLVWFAIDLGTRARNGTASAWLLLAIAATGAAACMFLALALGVRLVRSLGGADQAPPRPRGGRRAAR